MATVWVVTRIDRADWETDDITVCRVFSTEKAACDWVSKMNAMPHMRNTSWDYNEHDLDNPV